MYEEITFASKGNVNLHIISMRCRVGLESIIMCISQSSRVIDHVDLSRASIAALFYEDYSQWKLRCSLRGIPHGPACVYAIRAKDGRLAIGATRHYVASILHFSGFCYVFSAFYFACFNVFFAFGLSWLIYGLCAHLCMFCGLFAFFSVSCFVSRGLFSAVFLRVFSRFLLWFLFAITSYEDENVIFNH